ncbi:MAG: hypothetical protein KJ950_04970 [Proteobacteria bacterium]|nr:hypothetical protein [Pseudomonadota bacterium]MBU1688714.1 hypothetical protein [Pseudomonadota bacterium]
MSMLNLTPLGSIKTRILLAAFLWSCIGVMLIWRGENMTGGVGGLLLVVVAIILGTLKSRFVLDRVALKNMNRIIERGDSACIGGVYSTKTWILVLFMIVLGRLLRASPLPPWLVGLIYITVGWALLWSSRLAWLRGVRKNELVAPGSGVD